MSWQPPVHGLEYQGHAQGSTLHVQALAPILPSSSRRDFAAGGGRIFFSSSPAQEGGRGSLLVIGSQL